MRLYIKITGANAFSRAVGNVTPELKNAISEALHKNAEKVVEGARQRVHKKSGELAATIRDEYSPDGLVAWIRAGFGQLKRSPRSHRRSKSGSKVQGGQGDYAAVVEFGSKTENQQPHPFLFPAFDAQRAEFLDDMQHASDKALDEAVKKAGND